MPFSGGWGPELFNRNDSRGVGRAELDMAGFHITPARPVVERPSTANDAC
jgi:hypothetical protein